MIDYWWAFTVACVVCSLIGFVTECEPWFVLAIALGCVGVGLALA